MPGAKLKLRSFRRGRLSGQVATELEKMLLEKYQEGQLLPKEADLADHFGVSRIVLREAVKILEERGLLHVRAGSGTYVTRPSSDKVKESLLRLLRDRPLPQLADFELMLEVRGVLEETAARLAAVRATEQDLAEIDRALAGMMAEGPAAAEADLQFHLAIARAAHNPYLEMIIEPLTSVVLQHILLTNSYTVGVALHRGVADEIRRGSAVGARQAVRRLMDRTLSDIRTALALLDSGGTES